MPIVSLKIGGPSNPLASRNVNGERSINCLPERSSPGTPKVDPYLRKRPGKRLAFFVGSDPVGELFQQDGLAFGVSGTIFFEAFINLTTDPVSFTWTQRGTVAFDGEDQPSICSNGSPNGAGGHQLLIIAGHEGYVYDIVTHVFTLITDPAFPSGNALMCEFFGGYFFVLERNVPGFQWSALYDGLSWDALDSANRSWAPDYIAAIKRLGTQLWLIGSQTSEVWSLTGDDIIIAPMPGALLEYGTVAGSTVRRLPTSLAWVSQDERGTGLFIVARGYTPETVSTYSVTRAIQSGLLNTLVGWTFQDQGHLFYGLWWMNLDDTVPETTWVFDVTQQEWHEWAFWDATACRYFTDVAACHCFFSETNLMGDRRTGAVYQVGFQFDGQELVVV